MPYLVAFLASLTWFAFFQSWGNFHDPDAFYHAKIAALMAQYGPLKSFPWLDLTTLGHSFADQHFFFHILLIPFEKIFGMMPGTQIAGVLFAALFVAFYYFILRRLAIRVPWLWTILLATSSFIVIRLSLGKASPLALILLMLGLFALIRRKSFVAFIAGLGFALTHGGWIVLLACQSLYLVGEIAYAKIVEGDAWKKALGSSAWKIFFATLAGTAVGTVLHPNFPANISFLWVQVVKIGVGTPFDRVRLGAEWLPMEIGTLMAGLGMVLLAALLVGFGLLFARRTPLDRTRATASVALGVVVAGLFALTLKSARAVEYLVPVLILWLGTLATLVDEKRFIEEARSQIKAKAFQIFLGSLLVVLFVHDVVVTKGKLNESVYPFQVLSAPMAAISQEAKPGDRVFHSDWDFFPELFLQDDRLRYVAGLDPTFLLEANPRLSDEYVDIALGHTTTSDFEKIRDDFQAHFVIIRLLHHDVFAEALETDKRFVRLYDDGLIRAYRLAD